MRLAIALLSSFIAILFGTACTTSVDEPPTVTWHEHVAPIVKARCTSCHQEGGIGPFSLETYSNAKTTSGLMVKAVESGQMPPWSAVATDDCTPRFDWQDDPRLTPDEVDLLRQWHEDGAPEGDPAKAAKLPDPIEHNLDGVTHTLTPAQAYTTSGTQDQQTCFLMDPKLVTPTWLTGLQVTPGNLEVVHHAVVMMVPPEFAADAVAQAGPTGTFDCFSLQTNLGLYLAGVWVPGARPFEAPLGSGIPVEPGSLVLMNIHYHPTGYDHAPDLTSVALRMEPQQPAKNFIIITNFGNKGAAPELQPGPNDNGMVQFFIPADVANHTEKMVFPINADNATRYPMTAMFPHMHYVGVDLDMRIKRTNPAPGEPAEECLLKVPNWNFDWQRTYFYDAAQDNLPTIGDGDTIELRCLYNNTRQNPFVERMISEEKLSGPVDVFLGEQTTDEMCLVLFGVIY